MRRRMLLLVPIAAALAAPATALAGGWATTSLSSHPSGTTWNTEITVLQHGVTPMVGVQPSIEIRDQDGKTQTFPAKPTKRAGVYSASVRFPRGGEWQYRVHDGFTDYTLFWYPAVRVGDGAPLPALPPRAAPAGDPAPVAQLVAIGVVALLWIGGWLYGIRPERRRRAARTAAEPRLAAR
jgi:hypothetical protein